MSGAILIGAGGHARVLLDIAKLPPLMAEIVCDPKLAVASWYGLTVLEEEVVLRNRAGQQVKIINGIGHLAGDGLREKVYRRIKSMGYAFASAIHKTACISPCARAEEGVQVMAGAIIQSGAYVGENTIINTRASVDHDCGIGAHVHVAPGATICGGVTVGDGAFIGAGSTIIQGIKIGKNAIVGAGTVVVRDVADGEKIYGAHKSFDGHSDLIASGGRLRSFGDVRG